MLHEINQQLTLRIMSISTNLTSPLTIHLRELAFIVCRFTAMLQYRQGKSRQVVFVSLHFSLKPTFLRMSQIFDRHQHMDVLKVPIFSYYSIQPKMYSTIT